MTGAATGIGKAVATALAAGGARVAIDPWRFPAVALGVLVAKDGIA